MSHAIHVLLLGPVRVYGAIGTVPTDRAHALTELLAWLALHPESAYGCQIDRDLILSPGSRVSGLSRLRGWVGRPALPLTTGGSPYRLDAGTDWALAQSLVADQRGRLREGVSTGDLVGALRLVRGVPLADVASAWADAPRLMMVLLLRDAAVEALSRPLSTRVRMEVRALAAALLPSDRIDAAGLVA